MSDAPARHVVPREDDDSAAPRFAEMDMLPLEHDTAADRLDRLGDVRAGIDQDRDQPGVNVGLPVEQKQDMPGRRWSP